MRRHLAVSAYACCGQAHARGGRIEGSAWISVTPSRQRSTQRVAGLRVAVLAPVSWRVPPRNYGPWEQFASLLTEGLVERGVNVTLFATGDSRTAGRLASVVPRAYSEDPEAEPKVSECLHIAHVFERADEFDVIHNSFDFLPLTYSSLVETPVLTTIHGFRRRGSCPLPALQR